MFSNWKANLALCLGMTLSLLFGSAPARGATVTLQGTIAADDGVQLFELSVATAGTVDLRSYGYAGGITATGASVSGGGFDSVLTLFDASGRYLAENDDGVEVATDASTGLMGDARLTESLTVGTYILALTQYDNFSNGLNLADGFVEAGHPNFTADPSFASGGACPGNSFRDISGTSGRCRNGNWAISFSNVASATPITPVPEPSALLLVGLELAILFAIRKGRLKKFGVLAPGLMALLTCSLVKAQTSTGPDYSNVSDYLNGQRSLLKVQDLQVFRLSNSTYEATSQLMDIVPITTSSSGQIQGANTGGNTLYADPTRALRSFSAHMFRQPGASTLTALDSFQQAPDNLFQPAPGEFALWLQNVSSLNGGIGWWSPLPYGDNPTVTGGAAADFTGDGYDELALSFEDGRLLILTPNDLNNVFANFRDSVTSVTPLSDIVAGDFNGDGRPELAGLNILPSGGLRLVIFTVDPNSLVAKPVSSLDLQNTGATQSNPVTKVSIARGRFNSAGHDQLAVAFSVPPFGGKAEIIDFNPGTLTPAGPSSPATMTLPGVTNTVGYVQVKSGKFGLPSYPYDQLVYHNSSGDQTSGARFFQVYKVDPGTFSLQGTGPVIYDQVPCAAGIEIGNFDHRQANGPDLNDQIAFMYCSGSPRPDNPNWDGFNGFTLNIYNVNANTLSVDGSPASAQNLGQAIWIGGNTSAGVTFTATDLQGRSLILGEPTKVVVSNSAQPIAAVSSPPMHVDYVVPDGQTTPQVVNLSAVGNSTFSAKYQQQDSNEKASSITNSRSWSFGAKETGNFGFSIGAGNLKVNDVVTAAQNLKGENSTATDSYQSYTFKLTAATTGLGDFVSYTGNDFNVWIYPIIGKTTCPNGASTCDATAQVPLTLQYSAPNGNPVENEVQGETLSWYQPPWEPGNIFSYPANYQQLQSIYPNLATLSNEVDFQTDAISITEGSTWSGTESKTVSASLNQNYSFENELSVAASVKVPVYSADFGYKINLSGSVGFNDLTKSVSKIGSSTGIEVTKPAFNNTNYTYNIAAFILGDAPPANYVDSPQSLTTTPTSYGVLRSVFTADPLTPTSGAWWRGAYTRPDVALNHPNRWSITYKTNVSSPNWVNQFCAQLNPQSPSDPSSDRFHQMRGFFISSAGTPGQGPQLERAQAGDVLSLQARVYNYSLQSMDPGSKVHVRFYFTEWDTATNKPTGDSVLISEEEVPPIPAFDDASTALNWVLVPTTFNTNMFDITRKGNVSIAFWVLVWIQDANGNLVSEVPAHGLSAVPGTLTSFADAAKLEEIAGDGNSYSNNLAFYKQPFYIEGTTLVSPGPLPPGPLPPGPPSVPVDLQLSKISLSVNPIAQGGSVLASAMISTVGGAADDLLADWYEGDPQSDGHLVSEQRIVHVARDSQYKVQTSFQPNTCGTYELFLIVKGGANQPERRSTRVRVSCPQTSVAALSPR